MRCGSCQHEHTADSHLCERCGADVRLVREGMCSDHRIGNQFLFPGLGYGGSCFPKDTLAVVEMGRAHGYECRLNAAVHQVNQDQRDQFWRKITTHLGARLDGRTLAFWGVAFKPQTDDIREAPSISLMRHALAAGAAVRAYDPVAGPRLEPVLPEVTVQVVDAAEACGGTLVLLEEPPAPISSSEPSP